MRLIPQDAINELVNCVVNGSNDIERARAVSKLSVHYLSSNDAAVGQTIAGFVKDESVNKDLRLLGYVCLLDVSNRSCDQYPDLKTFRFPEDVDWEFVHQWLE